MTAPTRLPDSLLVDEDVTSLLRGLVPRSSVSAVAGELAATLGSTTLAATGTLPVAGALAATLGATTVTAAGLIVPKDGPGNVYTPLSSADWATLGLPAPDYQWNCQDASGNLAAAIGAYPTAFTNGTRLYQQTVSGWTRYFIGVDAGTGSWYLTDAATTPALNESVAMLVYAGMTIPTSQAATTLGCIGGNLSLNMTHNSSKRQIQLMTPEGNSTLSGVDYGDDATVIRPFLYGRDCTALTSAFLTDLEQVSGPTSVLAPSSATKPFFAFNSRARTIRIGLGAIWRGANAETILDKATLTTLGWSLPY